MSEQIEKTNYRIELEKNKVLAFVPGGKSMWPMLKNRGQSVVVQPKTEKLKKFDVALYQRDNGAFVLHRVITPTEYGYVMCGDSQFTLEKVKEDMVFGVMTGFYKGKEYIETDNLQYRKEVEEWYGNEKRRKRKLKRFYFNQRVKNKIKRIFSRLKKNV